VVLGGLVALAGVPFFQAEARPKAGGGYVCLRETFGLGLPLWMSVLLVISSGAIAAVAGCQLFPALAGLAGPRSVAVETSCCASITTSVSSPRR
jgi:hypothetical protein